MKAIAPSQFTDFRLKLLSPLWFSGGNLKFHSPTRVVAMNRIETEAITTNAMMLILITHA